MDEKEISIFEHHMGQGAEMVLERKDGTEDKYYFEPLGVEFLPKVMRLSAATESTKGEKDLIEKLKVDLKSRRITQSQFDNQMSEIEHKFGMKLLEEGNANLMVSLITEMVKQSYPNEDEKARSKFIYMNKFKLYKIFFELNKDMNEEGEKTKSQVEAMKARGKLKDGG